MADGSQINKASRNTSTDAGVSGAVRALTHLRGNARLFLRQLGYVPSEWCGGRTAKSFLHDVAYRSEDRGDWFLYAEDAEDPESFCPSEGYLRKWEGTW